MELSEKVKVGKEWSGWTPGRGEVGKHPQVLGLPSSHMGMPAPSRGCEVPGHEVRCGICSSVWTMNPLTVTMKAKPGGPSQISNNLQDFLQNPHIENGSHPPTPRI